MKVKQLRDERATKVADAQAIFDAAAKDNNRSLTAEEKERVRTIQAEIKALDEDLEIAETQERLTAEAAARTEPISGRNNHNTQHARDLAKYRVLNVVRATLPPSHEAYRELSGIEKEMHQEAQKDFRAASGETLKGIGIPQMLIGGTDQRDNSITNPTQPEDGSVLVQKEVRPVLDLLRPQSVLRDLGAQFLTDLVGNIGIPTMSQGAVSAWKGETETLDKSNQKFTEAEFSPNRLGTYAIRSKQFLVQTANSVENMLRADLEFSVLNKLEQTALTGSGTGNVPLGLLNNNDVQQLALGANGNPFTRASAIALLAKVMGANVPLSNPAYLMNVDTMAALMNTKVDEGSGKFLMEEANKLFGYKAAVTTNVPNNLTKGSTTGSLSALVFGNWRDLLIGQWGGMDITTDPYTLATEGQIRIIIQSFFDIMVQRPKAFAVVKDVNTTIPS